MGLEAAERALETAEVGEEEEEEEEEEEVGVVLMIENPPLASMNTWLGGGACGVPSIFSRASFPPPPLAFIAFLASLALPVLLAVAVVISFTFFSGPSGDTGPAVAGATVAPTVVTGEALEGKGAAAFTLLVLAMAGAAGSG